MELYNVYSKGDGTLIGHAYLHLASGGAAIEEEKLVLVQYCLGRGTGLLVSENNGDKWRPTEVEESIENSGHQTPTSVGESGGDLSTPDNYPHSQCLETTSTHDPNNNNDFKSESCQAKDNSSSVISSHTADATVESNEHSLCEEEMIKVEEVIKETRFAGKRTRPIAEKRRGLEKFVKILGRNEEGIMLSFCYFCDEVLCSRNMSRHMASLHLSKDTCYRCGRNRTGTSAEHTPYCDENKVEKDSKEIVKFGNPEKMSKFVKILGRNEKGIMMSFCYFCNTVCRGNLPRHMASLHLPKDTCYRCGESRTGTYAEHTHHCDENKVEKDSKEEEKNAKPENFPKFFKILGKNEKGRLLAHCYLCNVDLCSRNLLRHMTKIHLPKDTCYRCGRNRTGTYAMHKPYCDENKVQKEVNIELKGDTCDRNKIEIEAKVEESEDEGGVTSSCCDEGTVEQSCDEQRNTKFEGPVEINLGEMGINHEQVRDGEESDKPVCLTMCMEGQKMVRIMTKSNVKMVKVMRGFGRKTKNDWRSLRFTEERGKRVKETDTAGKVADGMVVVERKNIV